MTERSETQRSASNAPNPIRQNDACLGNGCGDFGFIEDLSTLIALKILVDDLEFEDHPTEACRDSETHERDTHGGSP